MLTFLGVAQRRGLQVVGYEANAQGTLEESDGKYRVTTITVQPTVSVAQEVDPALRDEVVRETVTSCIITNSLSGTVEFTPEFHSVSTPAA